MCGFFLLSDWVGLTTLPCSVLARRRRPPSHQYFGDKNLPIRIVSIEVMRWVILSQDPTHHMRPP